MSAICIHAHKSDGKPRAVVISEGREPFICLDLNDLVSIYLQGYNQVAVAHAREIAATLTDAADQLEQLLHPGVEGVAAVLR